MKLVVRMGGSSYTANGPRPPPRAIGSVATPPILTTEVVAGKQLTSTKAFSPQKFIIWRRGRGAHHLFRGSYFLITFGEIEIFRLENNFN